MRAFSQLLDDLVYTRSRNAKLRLIGAYLKETPNPDRGLALAALTGTLDIKAVKPAQVRAMALERIDPVLLAMKGSLFLTRPALADYIFDPAEKAQLAGELFDHVGSGRIRIEINQRYALEDAVQAHHDLESRKTTGSSIFVI